MEGTWEVAPAMEHMMMIILKTRRIKETCISSANAKYLKGIYTCHMPIAYFGSTFQFFLALCDSIMAGILAGKEQEAVGSLAAY